MLVLFCDAVIIVDYVAPEGRMTEEFQRIWREVFDVHFRFYPGIFLEGLRKIMKTSVRIASVPAGIKLSLTHSLMELSPS
jgi:hypothetical protein